MTYEDKNILARYLLNDWDFDGSEEAEERLADALDRAREDDANGRPVKWARTPSIESEEIAKKFIYI